MRICVFGDSIAFGMRDTESGGWAERLKIYLLNYCNPKQGIFKEVFNFADPGGVSDDMLGSIENDCNKILGTELRYKKINIVIIAIGINDSALQKDKEPKTSPEQFKENLEKIIDISKKFSNKIILVGITPVDESITAPIPWNTDFYHRNEWIRKYNEIIKSACKTENVNFIDIYGNWIKTDYKKLLEDGVHPNSEGHKLIFETVKDFLIKNNFDCSI